MTWLPWRCWGVAVIHFGCFLLMNHPIYPKTLHHRVIVSLPMYPLRLIENYPVLYNVANLHHGFGRPVDASLGSTPARCTTKHWQPVTWLTTGFPQPSDPCHWWLPIRWFPSFSDHRLGWWSRLSYVACKKNTLFLFPKQMQSTRVCGGSSYHPLKIIFILIKRGLDYICQNYFAMYLSCEIISTYLAHTFV